jgi:hypothetical protein
MTTYLMCKYTFFTPFRIICKKAKLPSFKNEIKNFLQVNTLIKIY